MDRRVQIFIEIPDGTYEQIELFEGDSISVSMSTQNIDDIAKIYTDFSQSFTVPASQRNNQIFSYFYDNDLNSEINHNKRRNAYIEIDLTHFRYGKIQLEKSKLTDNQIENYTITFYGLMVSLKDKFGEDKLTDLDMSNYIHPYTGQEIFNRITDETTDYDIRYPLISSSRLWSYGAGISGTDIDQNSGRIDFTELFPALKVLRILQQIENRYGIQFEGNFMTSERLSKLFLYCKNKQAFEFFTSTEIINFTTEAFDNTNCMNLATDTLTYTYPYGIEGHSVLLNISNVSNTSVKYWIDVYNNGVISHTIQGQGNQGFGVFYDLGQAYATREIYFKIRANGTLSFDATLQYNQNIDDPDFGPVNAVMTAQGFGQTITGNFGILQYLPNMKVSDFLSGLMKMFNLTCYSEDGTIYYLESLSDWYSKGAIVDVTEHVISSEAQIERIKLYRNMKFTYEKSESFMNRKYYENNLKEYGDLSYNFGYDGGDYNIQVPFENLMFNKFSGTNLQVGYILNNNYQPYENKPILLYMTKSESCHFHFDKGPSNDIATKYMVFGQDINVNGRDESLNWGAEVSTFLLSVITYGLYGLGYFQYLMNLFDLKNRMNRLKAVFPVSLITNLKLNDRLIIRDKRYIINELKTNIVTGEVEMALLNDLQPIANKTWSIGHSGGCIQVPIDLPSNVLTAEVYCMDLSVSITPNVFTSDGYATICIPSNPNSPNPTYFYIKVKYTYNDSQISDNIRYIIYQEP